MADRIEELRRTLPPNPGVRPRAARRAAHDGRAYIDYLSESRGLFLTQLSVTFRKLSLRLKRVEEMEHFEQVRRLGRECFDLIGDSVAHG